MKYAICFGMLVVGVVHSDLSLAQSPWEEVARFDVGRIRSACIFSGRDICFANNGDKEQKGGYFDKSLLQEFPKRPGEGLVDDPDCMYRVIEESPSKLISSFRRDGRVETRFYHPLSIAQNHSGDGMTRHDQISYSHHEYEGDVGILITAVGKRLPSGEFNFSGLTIHAKIMSANLPRNMSLEQAKEFLPKRIGQIIVQRSCPLNL
jgi:hypothetical protein